jgi:microcin C transport system permease protein
MRISYYIRGEFLREKTRNYVAAARVMGESDLAVMFKHILPNSLTPVISYAPFAVVGNISSLVALDFLGFGLPPPAPSWGELLHQGTQNIFEWHLVLFPLIAIFLTLQLTVFVGEAVREAFDPRVFSRLR